MKANYESKKYQRQIRQAFHRLGLCSCGSNTDYAIVHDMLERAESFHAKENQPSFYDPMGDIPANAVEFIAKVLDNAKLLEHGSSIGCAWLTDDGKAVLRFLRDFGVESSTPCDDDGAWPDWWCSSNAGEEF